MANWRLEGRVEKKRVNEIVNKGGKLQEKKQLFCYFFGIVNAVAL